MLKRSLVVNIVNVLVVISVLAGAGVLGLIAISGVSSATAFSIGSPTTVTSGSVTQIQVPITIGNRGYFSFSDIDVQVTVKDSAGDQLLAGSLGPFSVAPGQTRQVNASLSLDTSKLPASTLQNLATTSQNLTVSATLGASMPPFLGVSGAVTAQLRWGAPVSNLKEGTPTFSRYNSTTVEVKVPISFSNDNQFLTISGTGQVKVLDSTDQQVGRGSVTLNVPPKGQFSQSVALFLKLPQSQLQSLLTTDQALSYTAVLSLPNGGAGGFTLSQPITYQWGAPFAGLTIGSPVVSSHNSTYFQVSVPVSFADHSSSIAVNTDLVAKVVNATSGLVVGTGALSVQASPGGSYSGNLVVYTKIPTASLGTLLFNDATLHYSAQVTGASDGVSASFSKSFDVAWGAPLKNLAFGKVSAGVYNATYSSMTTLFSFTDNSAFLGVSGTIGGTITDLSGNVVGSILPLTISANPGGGYSGPLQGYIQNTAVGQSSYILHLTFTSQYGTVTRLVTVSA